MEHIKYDLGQVDRGSTAVVTLDIQANVLLMDSSNYRAYTSGRRHKYFGGLCRQSPAQIVVPSTGHWYVAIDLGGSSGNVRSSVDVVPPT